MILALLFACSPLPETITMTGTVGDTPYGGGGVVAGAVVTVIDDVYEAVDVQTADGDGEFAILVPAGVPFFLTVTADGHVPTAFSGTAGVYDFGAPPGYPWVASDAWMAELRADFAACPTLDAPGAIVAGEVRGSTPGITYAELPLVPTGTARAIDLDGTEYPACYLDDDGVSVADGTDVGTTGRFVIFGVPAGPVIVDVRYTDPAGDVPVELYQFVAPDAGLVPLYPALVNAL
ncbi:MAG: hypothetical protein Q8P41_20650 [Pseudomonadota bacterium]|nr:hypothetical protein [Pseudomonadota bacterium]